MIWAFERAKSLGRVDGGELASPKSIAGGSGNPPRVPRTIEKKDVGLLCSLVRDYRLPHECVPTEMRQHAEVWEALLPEMGLTAVVRNLGKMTEVGLLGAFSDAERLVVSRLERAEALRAARVHPLQIQRVAVDQRQEGTRVDGF